MSSMEVNIDMLEQMDLMDVCDQEALDVFLNSGSEDNTVLSPAAGGGDSLAGRPPRPPAPRRGRVLGAPGQALGSASRPATWGPSARPTRLGGPRSPIQVVPLPPPALKALGVRL